MPATHPASSTHTTQLAWYTLCLLLCTIASPAIAADGEQAPPAARASPSVSTVKVPGLQQPAQILIDRWGVPHIYAASQDDVFFVQGYNAARDRLFQIDLWRRRGLGRLSEVFGPAYVEQDTASRLFLYRGDMQKEWQAYGKNAQGIAERFVAGINAYIDAVAADPQKLPFEFRQFAYAPEKWQAQDVVRIRSHALTRNLTSEVARAFVACHDNVKTDATRVRLSPAWETQVPEGLDPCLPKDLLKVFQLATQGVTLGQGAMQSGSADAEEPGLAFAMGLAPAPLEGSNAWALAPSKTTTGRTMLASDPHRAYCVPSLRYIAHLNAPKLDVVGAGEPALPGISIGHNGQIAFGLTIFSIDQEDLYTYALNPANPQEYRYKGQWEKFTVLRESIAVKGAKPMQAELRFTRHGPVIYTEANKDRAYAVRSAWFEPGMAPYFGSIDYMFARNFQEFRQAMARWGAPSENQVYADAKGNIGWVAGGLAPVRPNWDGLLPVPGDGRYEWAGFLPGEQLPWVYNPAQGWFASANEMNLPADYPYQTRKLGFEWPGNDRYQRLREVLAKPGKRSLEDSMHLQNDVLSTPARRIVTLLKKIQIDDNKTQAALQMLRGWDSVERADSAAAALFEVWWSRYLGYVFKEVALNKKAAATIGMPDTTVLLEGLEKPETIFGSDAVAKRDWVLLTSLNLAWTDTQRLLGADPRQWQWGKLQHTSITHPFATATDATTAAKLNVGPLPKHGGASTPNQSSYDPRDFRQLSGPSFRVVIDVGNWDNSRAINMPGQSGDPDSPHYKDLSSMWLKGDYFPLLYSRKRVEAATVHRIDLQPGP
jgi:penicillin amidase